MASGTALSARNPTLLRLRAHPLKIALVGNPNVGKSVFFGRLTGRYATVSNYPGTTVTITSGRALVGAEVCDVGVTSGASIRVLQTFPGIVFECDQTEMAVERAVARAILVDVERR
jgi:predicted GTPase